MWCRKYIGQYILSLPHSFQFSCLFAHIGPIQNNTRNISMEKRTEKTKSKILLASSRECNTYIACDAHVIDSMKYIWIQSSFRFRPHWNLELTPIVLWFWLIMTTKLHYSSHQSIVLFHNQFFPSGEHPNNVYSLISRTTNCQLYSNISQILLRYKILGYYNNFDSMKSFGYFTDI